MTYFSGHMHFKRQNHSVNSIFVGGLSLHFRVFRSRCGDKVRDSGHDEAVGEREFNYHVTLFTEN